MSIFAFHAKKNQYKKMDKSQLLNYLVLQLDKIKMPDFDPETWKGSAISFLDNLLGNNNVWSKQIGYLKGVEKISYEELYPKKILDLNGTKRLFSQTLTEIIDQVKILEEGDLFETKSTTKAGNETLNTVINSLKNNLTGKEMSELKQAAQKEPGEKSGAILEIVRKWDIETTQQVLADTLATQEIWDSGI